MTADDQRFGPASEEVAAQVHRVVAVLSGPGGPTGGIKRLERDLTAVAASRLLSPYERGLIDGVLGVVRALVPNEPHGGLAEQVAPFEPGSVPARLLLEIASGVRGANADLADRLDTD